MRDACCIMHASNAHHRLSPGSVLANFQPLQIAIGFSCQRPRHTLACKAGSLQNESSIQLPAGGLPSTSGAVQRTPGAVWALIALQGVALLGALVGGTLARKRRLELQGLNVRLRQINSELRKRTAAEGDPVCAAGEEEALSTYRHALESALGQASAAHPYETYGEQNLSLAQARRQLALRIREGRSALYENDGQLALQKANESEAMAADLRDLRASRAVTRLKASALKQVGDLKAALEQLESALSISHQLEDHSHDADVLGEIADTYADLGDFERAAQAYDKCILAIQEETASPQLSSWDC